jgi:hypothetical protein
MACLVKHRDNFTFTLAFKDLDKGVCGIFQDITRHSLEKAEENHENRSQNIR